MKKINLLFGLKERVSRSEYLIWGILLMLLKYGGEASFYYLAANKLITPLQFLSPLLFVRYPDFSQLPDWFAPAIVLWSLPFVWIGVCMSIRRAADANLTPWFGLLFFFPIVNYFLMFGLSLAPTSKAGVWSEREFKIENAKWMSPIFLSLILALVGTLLVWFGTNYLKVYAYSLFLGSPLILGLVQGYLLNNRIRQSLAWTIWPVALTVILIHLLLLLFALEGIICLAMSLPISIVLAVLGGILGKGIASYGKPQTATPVFLVFVLPIMAFSEAHFGQSAHSDMVLSSVEISVPPEKVWPNVIQFSDLPPTQPSDWLFRLGVSYPVRARIAGQGVGAVRRCEFSTGAFVEPITLWSEPNRLAFDVQYQPPPMRELSFYDHVDAPHLNGYFRSVRGEFRLISLPNGKTLLEGRTWYEMDIHPGWYWQWYGRYFIHNIHMRVLNHIKSLAEA